MQPTEPDGWVAKAFLSLKFYVMKFWWHFDPFWAKLIDWQRHLAFKNPNFFLRFNHLKMLVNIYKIQTYVYFLKVIFISRA